MSLKKGCFSWACKENPWKTALERDHESTRSRNESEAWTSEAHIR